MQNELIPIDSPVATRKPIRFLSLFSGIEAASRAWLSLGWECVGVAEVEPFPCAVLAHHYPAVPNLGDVTQITEERIKQLGHIDLVVGGFPCQDLSVAGKRKGLTHADGTLTRSGLFFTGMQIFHWARQHCGARYLLVENVPGLLSSNQGRDFAAVVGHMAGLEGVGVPTHGWGAEGAAAGDNGLLEWGCIDAQWFHLAQRRRRVFALLDTGDWANRPPVLLEPEGLRGDSPPSRKAAESTAVCPTLRAGGNRTGGDRPPGTDVDTADSLIAHSLRADGFDASEDGTGQGTPLVPVYSVCQGSDPLWAVNTAMPITTRHGDPGVIAFSCKDHGADAGDTAPTLRAMGHESSHANAGGQVAVAFDLRGREGGAVPEGPHDTANIRAASGGSSRSYIAEPMAVRRLTVTECERLQGFPDGYTLVPYRGKPAADGPRYKALGNSMAIPVVSWIGTRIQMIEELMATDK